jgi:hypothetical protein
MRSLQTVVSTQAHPTRISLPCLHQAHVAHFSRRSSFRGGRVLADLSGKPRGLQVAERKFLELDVDTFSGRLKATKPRVTFNLPNTLTEEDNLINAKPYNLTPPS